MCMYEMGRKLLAHVTFVLPGPTSKWKQQKIKSDVIRFQVNFMLCMPGTFEFSWLRYVMCMIFFISGNLASNRSMIYGLWLMKNVGAISLSEWVFRKLKHKFDLVNQSW